MRITASEEDMVKFKPEDASLTEANMRAVLKQFKVFPHEFNDDGDDVDEDNGDDVDEDDGDDVDEDNGDDVGEDDGDKDGDDGDKDNGDDVDEDDDDILGW